MHTHSGPAAHDDYGAVPGVLGLYATETVWWTSRPMWFLLWSGVFERFPNLKMAVTESGSYWAPDMLWRMDSLLLKDQGSRKLDDSVKGLLTMMPSEYFDRNCGLGSSNTRRRELARRYEIGVGNLMWGNDFPHPEGTWPYTKKILREAFWDIPVDETARDPRAQRRRVLRLRRRRAPPDRRRDRADARGARPDRRAGVPQVGRPARGRAPLAHRPGSGAGRALRHGARGAGARRQGRPRHRRGTRDRTRHRAALAKPGARSPSSSATPRPGRAPSTRSSALGGDAIAIAGSVRDAPTARRVSPPPSSSSVASTCS